MFPNALTRFFRLAPVLAASSAFAVDITFFAVSDPHYGQTGTSTAAGQSKDTSRARMPGILNNLPGTAYPSAAGGGVVAEPRAVLVVGDLIEMIDSALWSGYDADYGVLGNRKLRFPTYEALGNHDFYITGGIKDTFYLVNRMIDRNRLRAAGFTNADGTGYHYSWDWDGVHFVNLNLYAGGSEWGYNGYRPMNALQFLQQDLAAHVGSSGRPVFIMQHYPLNDNTYFSQSLRTPFYNALLNYNVIGILHGHSHAEKFYSWNNGTGPMNIPIYDDGTVMDGDLMVFHITDGRMVTTHRRTTSGQNQWSTLIKDTTISMGAATAVTAPDGGRAGLFRAAGTLRRIPASARWVEVVDLQGRLIRRVAVRDLLAEWDRRDARGRAVSPGIYFLKAGSAVLGKIVLR